MPLDENLEITPGNVGKMRILNALSRLAQDSRFEDITVKDICRGAGISRQTFYRHFSSKFDAVNWLWITLEQDCIRRLGRDLTWHESLLIMFGHARDYFDFFKATLSEGMESSFDFGVKARATCLADTITGQLGLTLTPDLKLQIEFFAVGEAYTVKSLMASSDSLDAEALTRQMEKCIPGELKDLLDGAVTAKRAAEAGRQSQDDARTPAKSAP